MTQGPPGRSFVTCWGLVVAPSQTRVSSLTMDADKNAKKRRSFLGFKRSTNTTDVDGSFKIRVSPVEVGSWNPIIYYGLLHHPRWLGMGFLNHQQYCGKLRLRVSFALRIWTRFFMLFCLFFNLQTTSFEIPILWSGNLKGLLIMIVSDWLVVVMGMVVTIDYH